MLVKVKISEKDINLATRDACNCPIARALKRVVSPEYKIHVNETHLYLTNKCGVTIIPLNDDAKVFIYSFDNSFWVEPIEFELDIPDSVKLVEDI